MTKRSKRFWFIMLILVCFGAAVGLSLFALKDKVSYFLTPMELTSATVDWSGKRVRLGGIVKPDSVQKRDEGGIIRFLVVDGAAEVAVIYDGTLPDLFREGQTIIVDGVFDKGIITAQTVLAKHDENYKPPEITDKFQMDSQLRQKIDY